MHLDIHDRLSLQDKFPSLDSCWTAGILLAKEMRKIPSNVTVRRRCRTFPAAAVLRLDPTARGRDLPYRRRRRRDHPGIIASRLPRQTMSIVLVYRAGGEGAASESNGVSYRTRISAGLGIFSPVLHLATNTTDTRRVDSCLRAEREGGYCLRWQAG